VSSRAPLLVLGLAVAACGGPAPAVEVPVVADTADAGAVRSAPLAIAPPEPERAPSLTELLRAQLRAQASSIDGQDGTLFRQAADREEAGDLAGARASFFELIKNAPSSPLVPYAYLAFADLFFREAENDQPDKWTLAQQAYQEVVKYPPPKNIAYAYAWQRLGESFLRNKEPTRALDAARKAIQAVAAHKDLAVGPETATAARRDLVIAYASAGQPDRAFAFFRSTDAENTPALILALGEEYVRRGSPREAIALYAQALKTAKSPALCAATEEAVQKLLPNADAQTKPQLVQLETSRKSTCAP
jgi:tetratricopeptide (TPR) repeat protein